MVKGRAATTRPYSANLCILHPVWLPLVSSFSTEEVCGKVVVVRIRQVVALGSVPETIDYGELQGLQALVVGGRWSLVIKAGFTVLRILHIIPV